MNRVRPIRNGNAEYRRAVWPPGKDLHPGMAVGVSKRIAPKDLLIIPSMIHQNILLSVL
ncbi:hypothetical protein D3C81_2063730 [compost metagenome]